VAVAVEADESADAAFNFAWHHNPQEQFICYNLAPALHLTRVVYRSKRKKINPNQLIGFREYFIFNSSNIPFNETPTEFPPAITVSFLAIP
jgi:hypothetical protein